MMGSDARRIKPSAKLSVRDMPEPRSMTSAWKCSRCGSLSLVKEGGFRGFSTHECARVSCNSLLLLARNSSSEGDCAWEFSQGTLMKGCRCGHPVVQIKKRMTRLLGLNHAIAQVLGQIRVAGPLRPHNLPRVDWWQMQALRGRPGPPRAGLGHESSKARHGG
jgi:hypothetical protein